jgi:ACS family hexuronate transporter-like MFS transporter
VSPAPLRPIRAWAVVSVATATMAISYLDRQVLAVLAPTVTEKLRISEAEYGWLASAFSIAYLVSAPLAGRLLEKVGVRHGLLWAVIAWTVVSGMHAFVPSYTALFVMRLCLGVTESPSFPGSASAVARALPAHLRSAGMGVLFTGSSFGAMVAPPLATALSEALDSWRGAFVGVAIIGALWVPLWIAITWAAPVKRALDHQPPPAERLSFVAALLHPAVLRAALIIFAVSPIFAFGFLWGSKLLVAAHGIEQAEVGGYLWLPPLLSDVGSVAFGAMAAAYAKRLGPLRSPVLLVGIALAVALTLGAGAYCRTPWETTILLGVAMLGGAGIFAMVTADMIARVGPALAATAGGVTAAAQSLAYIAANPLIGAAIDSWHSYDRVMPIVALFAIPGTVIWMLTKNAGLPRAER